MHAFVLCGGVWASVNRQCAAGDARNVEGKNATEKIRAGNVLFAVECIELVENCLDISCAIASVTETDSKKSCQFDIVTRILCVLDTLCHH